jgi:hypothetical protein
MQHDAFAHIRDGNTSHDYQRSDHITLSPCLQHETVGVCWFCDPLAFCEGHVLVETEDGTHSVLGFRLSQILMVWTVVTGGETKSMTDDWEIQVSGCGERGVLDVGDWDTSKRHWGDG